MKLLLFIFLWSFVRADLPPCDSDIYCHGDILKTIQTARVFEDSKHFVDMPMKRNRNEIKSRFQQLMRDTKNNPDKKELLEFINDNFLEPGSDSHYVTPNDWKPNPKFLDKIQNKNLKEWAGNLHEFWENLTLKVDESVRRNPDRYSLIYVPNPVVVPGSRFREYYYWDTYFTMKGLMRSELYDTVRGMLENFFQIIKKYGFIPNGGRVYYTRRSQPPFLMPMMKLYMDQNNDINFLRSNIHYLKDEYSFWKRNRTVNVEVEGDTYSMFVYDVKAEGPRPESYIEDVNTASVFEEEEKREELYKDLKSAAESGWDFSSRWFIKDGTNKGNLSYTATRSIVPVDLNSLMCLNAKILAEFYQKLGRKSDAAKFNNEADKQTEAISRVLWDKDMGIWLDYDRKNKKRRPYFAMSNIFPMWAGCYKSRRNKRGVTEKVLKYIKESDALDYSYAVPTTLTRTGQQWDFPNSWAPSQYVLIESLMMMDTKEAEELARDLIIKWIGTNYRCYKKTGHMYEKYNANSGFGGSGGEYANQVGFGWTNGVALEFLAKYSSILEKAEENFSNLRCCGTSVALFSALVWMAVVVGLWV